MDQLWPRYETQACGCLSNVGHLRTLSEYHARDQSRSPATSDGRVSQPWSALLATVAIVGALFIVLCWRLGAPSFWDPDEAHYAETTRELIATGHWWTPYYNQEPFFDKPILFHQLQATAMLVFGQNELGARVVPAMAVLALVIITALVGATLISLDAGIIAALILATNPLAFALARYAIIDTLFTAFLFGGVSLVAVAALRGRSRLQDPGYVLIACAVLTKGPLALVLCALTMALAIAISAEARRQLLGLRWIAGLGIVLAVSAPWFIYMYSRFGDQFVAGYFLDENIRLYATNRFGGGLGIWFYLRILAVDLLPWTGIAIGRLVDDVRAQVSGTKCDSVEVLLWAWTIAVVGFFTFSRFKLDHYVYSAVPAFGLLCARAWSDVRACPYAAEYRGARTGCRLVGPLLVVVGVGAGYFLIAWPEVPSAAMVVPAFVAIGGVIMTVDANIRGGRPPRVPWIGFMAVTAIYAGALLFVVPALESRKVVPDVARWVAGHADPSSRVAAYRLDRWNTAFRFYVDRHTAMLGSPDEAIAFFNGAGPFYCVMLEPAYKEFVARGVPLQEVYMREGMWATSGRVLWRGLLPPTRFVVVTKAGEAGGPGRAGAVQPVPPSASTREVKRHARRALPRARVDGAV